LSRDGKNVPNDPSEVHGRRNSRARRPAGQSSRPWPDFRRGCRYFASCVLAQGRKEESGFVKRVAALTLEQIVINAMGSPTEY
jgi:hypothetical protein